MIFAALILERNPLDWSTLPVAAMAWVQNAGAVAAFMAMVLLVSRLLNGDDRSPMTRMPAVVNVLLYLCLAAYALVAVVLMSHVLGVQSVAAWMPRDPRDPRGPAVLDWVLTVCGMVVLLTVLLPVFYHLFVHVSARRVWAMALLSIKEALRSRLLLVFSVMALVFLFAEWFIETRKPEDQLRNYVKVLYWSMTPLFLLLSGLLGAFSIPRDVLNNSIHTIVTKPVQKFEIVLGRFLGYALLLTAGLACIGVLSLGYLVRGVTEAAAAESYKARVPVFGQLSFYGTSSKSRGESVGREWSYRSYITGPSDVNPNAPRQMAVWSFLNIPKEFATRNGPIRLEFTLDIYRMSKGQEEVGPPCTFVVARGDLAPQEVIPLSETIQQEREKLQNEIRASFDLNEAPREQREHLQAELNKKFQDLDAELVQKYAFFERRGVNIVDNHTQALEFPSEVFAATGTGQAKQTAAGTIPVVNVYVIVDRARESQMIGVAQRDVYFLAAENPFWLNFLKGIVGLWCTFMLVLCISISCSAYLSGVVSWITSVFFYFAGLFTEHLQQVAANTVPGGGPSITSYRLTSRIVAGAPLEETPTVRMLQFSDRIFGWLIGRFLNLVPDINRYDLSDYVSNGFDIDVVNLLLIDNLLPLAAFVVPWLAISYYLINYREIANPQ